MESKTYLKFANWILRACVASAIVIALVCQSFMTVGTDEAWVLMGVRSLFMPFKEGMTSSPVVTSSGLYTIVEAILLQISTDSIWLHRAFPIVCGAIICLVLFRYESKRGSDFDTCLIPVAVMLGSPGFLIMSTTALGTVPAFLLFFVASLYWFTTTPPSKAKIVVTGFLFGLAAATRTDLILFAPAVVLARMTCPGLKNRGARVVEAMAVAIVGALTFILNGRIHDLFRRPEELAINLGTTAGFLGNFFDYPRLLNKVVISNSFLPFSVMIFIAFLVVSNRNQKRDFEWQYFLLCFGFIAWIAWTLRAPIPHLRYLWPSHAAFAVVLGLNLSRLCCEQVVPLMRPACVSIAIAIAADGLGCTSRHVVFGSSDIVSWEWTRETGLSYFRRFQHWKDEQQLVSYLNENAKPGEVLSVVGPPFRYRYLTGLPCFDYVRFPGELLKKQDMKYRLVVGPEVGTYFYISPEAYVFLKDECVLEYANGDYSIYNVSDVDRLISMDPFIRANYRSHPNSPDRFGVHPR